MSLSEKEGRIIEEQAGFRGRYSTVDHIFTLYSIVPPKKIDNWLLTPSQPRRSYQLVQKYLLSNTKLYVAFVDFKKALILLMRALCQVHRKTVVNENVYFALKIFMIQC